MSELENDECDVERMERQARARVKDEGGIQSWRQMILRRNWGLRRVR